MAQSEVTSKARRSKNRWFMRITKVLSTYQMDILYKSTKAHIGPFSSSPRTKTVKVPWGPPVSCEYNVRSAGNGSSFNIFLFRNGNNETAGFDESLFDNLEVNIDGGGVSSFAQRVTSMYVADKKQLLAMYLSLLQHSKEFVHHNESTHDLEGFALNGTGFTKEDIMAAGGSLIDLQEFIRIAKISAKCVNDVNQAYLTMHNMIVDGKRQLEENLFSSSSNKKARVDSVNVKEADELNDPKGLEVQWKKSYVGRASIPLDSILVPSELFNLNTDRVNRIAESMKVRYDPTQTTVVVCPADLAKKVDLQNIADTKFSVVQKAHTVSAFKLLDEEGEFQKLIGHHHREVMVCVVSTNSLALNAYGNVRTKIIESNFVEAPRPQDLIHLYNALVRNEDVNCLEIITRMSRHCRFGPNETTSILKLCKRSEVFRISLIEILTKFELYETIDGRHVKNHAVAMKRGDKLKMPNNMLNSLAKIDESFFLQHFTKVVSGKTSLKELVDQGLHRLAVKKVASTLCQLTGYTNINNLNTQYDNRFDGQILEHFIGAEQCKGKLNSQAKALKKYYDDVVNNGSANICVKMKEGSFGNITSGSLCLDFDTIIAQIKNFDSEWWMNFMNTIINSGKSYHASLLLVPSELLQFKITSFLRSQKDGVAKSLKVFPIVFLNRGAARTNEEGYNENSTYGVLFGRFTVLKPPIFFSYPSIESIADIVVSLCPPATSIVFIADEGYSLFKLHEGSELPYNVTYIGSKKSLAKLKSDLGKSNTSSSFSKDISGGNETGTIETEPAENSVTTSGNENRSIEIESAELGETTSSVVNSNVETYMKGKSLDESSTSPIKAPSSIQFNDSGIELSQNCSQNIFSVKNVHFSSTQNELHNDPYKFVE